MLQILPSDDNLTAFPPVETAMKEPNGLLMAGGNLNPDRLVDAYRHGIFPWYEEGEPVLWWSPDPRCVLWPHKLKVSRSLEKTLRNRGYRVTRNLAFRTVMENCSKPRPGSTGTWITQDMVSAYCRLHRFHIAQSVEVWHDDVLIGGLYGIVLGNVFIGESMFSRQRDASKVALVNLARSSDFELIDCQLETPHLMSLGAENISRAEYLECLRKWGDLDAELFRV